MMEMKKAVVVANTWSRVGGLEIVVQNIVKALADLGFLVTVITPRIIGCDDFKVPNVTVKCIAPKNRFLYSLWFRLFRFRCLARAVNKAFAGESGVLVFGHVHLLPLLHYLNRPERMRKIVWTYGIDVWGQEGRRWAELMNKMDDVVSISEYTARHEREAGVDESRIRLIPCSIALERFSPTKSPEKIRRNEIMICGRLSSAERYKGHEVLFAALPIAEKLLKRSLRLRVVGTGDDLPRLKARASELGVAERVIFCGRVSDEELMDAYRHCGVFAMPSRAERRQDTGMWTGEGFGLVYAEAEACGRPVVGSPDGGAREAVVDGETGLLADPRDPRKVAEAIAKILSDPVLADQMGAKGAEFVNRAFSFDAFRENVRQLVEN